jgi:acetoin utilization protein AcuB
LASSAESFMKEAKNFLRVRDCMSVDPATVGPKDSLQRVIELLRRRDIRSVPVVEKGKLIGIVTDRDVRQVAPAHPLFRDEDEIHRYTENLTVTAAMMADPMTIGPHAPLVEAAKVLETYRISSMPVVDDARLVGMLTVTDVLRVFVEQDEELAAGRRGVDSTHEEDRPASFGG